MSTEEKDMEEEEGALWPFPSSMPKCLGHKRNGHKVSDSYKWRVRIVPYYLN
jgi:hypothetical protein